jgi:hypothetical protein
LFGGFQVVGREHCGLVVLQLAHFGYWTQWSL